MLQIAADIAFIGKLHHISKLGKLDARSLTCSFIGRGDVVVCRVGAVGIVHADAHKQVAAGKR